MKKLLMITFCVGIGCLHAFHPAMAEYDNEGDCQGNCPMGDTINNFGDTNNEGGTGIGVGIGIGKAEAKANASASAHAGALALGYVKGGDQYTSVYNKLYTSYYNKLSQSQVGIVANVGPQVVITDASVVTYEQKYQAPSMVAPGIDTSQLNVKCPLFVQDGWSGSLSGPGAGASAGATDAEAIPECFAKLVAESSTGDKKTKANLTMYCLAFERIGVENTSCVGWRETVGGEKAVEAARARETSTFDDPADRS